MERELRNCIFISSNNLFFKFGYVMNITERIFFAPEMVLKRNKVKNEMTIYNMITFYFQRENMTSLHSPTLIQK